jgi:hypothetical protein
MHRHARLTTALACLAAALTLAGCSTFTPASQHAATQPAPTRRRSPSPGPTPSPTPTSCARNAPGFPCLMRDRIREVRRYLHRLPGSIGVVLDDRATGAIWRNANARTEYPAASTMKLAVMTDLLLRNQSGNIHLTATDWKEMYPALHTSNDTDAKDLWDRYEDGSFLHRIQAFGMTGAEFTSPVPNWGFMYCTPADLDHLMNYVLTKTPTGLRNYLVGQLQHVSALDQQWGVWGAGPQNHPGNKDGWEQDPSPYGTWITNTVGFAGPRQQYTLAIMYNLQNYDENGNTGFKYGTNKLTQIAAMLFQGQHTTAPHPLPSAVP